MITVVYAGERGSFGELAAIEYFGSKAVISNVAEFSDVFATVKDEKADFGIVPIENSLAGSIHQNFDSLLESGLHVTGEILLRVSQFLMANEGVTLKSVAEVYSHPAALAQCKKYLARFPKIKSIAISNTAAAVKKIKEEKLNNAAAIGSMQAAIDFDMKVLAKNIEDNKWNTTRFIILSKQQSNAKKNKVPMKTSIVFSTKNIPGVLFKCLSVFALRDIDLFKIESRPVHGKGFEYMFYLDFQGDISDEAQQNAISHLQEITMFYRHLGSYPVGKEAHPEYKKRH